ncbi:hypothetical protein QBC46DRAFT_367034 [Diplogelasinospora grovesii]|uniref:DUF7924 domain-containing protein n=1 Tax=Diplogelasinospora grovesii TaxID=303347 RepID=A0AAN6S180_9PEZI|nr:hypothetical protein QBC46DRAFT_367034 [Diplogelasinospora grovesii]
MNSGVSKAWTRRSRPKHFKHLYASFLKDFVDPLYPNPISVHTLVSEWLESVGSDREKHCRSDSYLHHLDDVPISRQLTRLAPEMGYTRDADGFVVPPTPASTRASSYRATEDSASSTASLPDYISSRVKELRAKRDSLSPSSEQIDKYLNELGTLAEGCIKADVKGFLEDTVFLKPSDLTYRRSVGLRSVKSSLMSSHLIPNNPESQFKGLHPRNARFAEATTQGLRFPFFAIKFKAAGGTRGDLWVATNQCAGASSACLNAVDQLNTSLRDHQSVQRVDNLSYCIALYISWKEDGLNYYLQRVNAFLLSRPEDFKSFRKQGKDTRLTQIRDALDTILKENRKKAAEHANKKRKSSSSRRNSSRSNSQLQGFVNASDYTTPQDTDRGLTLPECHCPEDEQQDHGPALASFSLAAEPLAGFLTDPPTEEQLTAAANGS